MTAFLEKVARGICETERPLCYDTTWAGVCECPATKAKYIAMARAAVEAMREPDEAMWDGLPRQIIMWMDMEPKTPRALFKHLERSGYDVPQWLRDEPEMQALDHVPSKGTRAVIVFKAMIGAALGEEG